MFFVLSKMLLFLISPVFWILALIVLSLIFKNPKLKQRLLISCIIIFILFSNNFIFSTATKKWEIKIAKFGYVEKKFTYGVVLGGMVEGNLKTRQIHFSASIDRLLEAIALYRKGDIEKILITGGSGAVFNQNNKESNLLHDVCIDLGIPDSVLIIETNSKNTHENALLTKQLIGTNSEILLITSGFHMRRAAACFKHEGFKLEMLSTDPLEVLNLGPDDYFVPKANPLEKWSYLIKEWFGYLAYKIAGYI